MWNGCIYPSKKYQVKLHSSPRFSAVCAAAITHRNHFFRLYQQYKFSASRFKFKQASDRWKKILEVSKVAYAFKKEAVTSKDVWP